MRLVTSSSYALKVRMPGVAVATAARAAPAVPMAGFVGNTSILLYF